VKAIIPLLLAAIVFVGCSDRPVIKDNSTVVVYPGLGISNICAVGMTYEQIRKATGDARLIGSGAGGWKRWIPGRSKSRFVSIPSLSATTEYRDPNPIPGVTFHVATNPWNSIPFRGKIGTKLSFQDGTVSKEQVEAAFGSVRTNFTGVSFQQVSVKPRESFSVTWDPNLLTINYPAQGIEFILKSNIVTMVVIKRISQMAK
jgi:hypothetical protein